MQRETVRTIKTVVVERSRVWEQSSSKLCLVDGGGCEGAGKAVGRRSDRNGGPRSRTALNGSRTSRRKQSGGACGSGID